jgi:hypothetical protein
LQAVPFAVLAFATGYAHADFTGLVVKVSDGDTLTVLAKKTQVWVRLNANDAPGSPRSVRHLIYGITNDCLPTCLAAKSPT